MSDLISLLMSRTTSADEVVTLQQLHTRLCKTKDIISPENFPQQDEDVFKLDLSDEGNNAPPIPQSLCQNQEDLNKFTCYLFERRFGWSETGKEDGRRVRRLSSTGATMSAGSEKEKAIINGLLDQLMKWYMSQDLLSPILKALKYTIKHTANMPVVRNRAVIHFTDWCKQRSEQLRECTFYTEIKELIILSITDVWSAIRNACANRLPPIVSSFSEDQTQNLFSGLVLVCSGDSSWQMKEGAIMGINALLQRYHNRSNCKSPMSSPRVLETETDEMKVPEFIQEKIHRVVFDLLSNSQLTIREHAAKTLATYITCSSIKTALATLQEVVLILQKGSTTHGENTQGKPSHFLDDYASEGFLGVCIFLVKVIPLHCLLPGWPEYMSTFLRYLSHPASTVRQAASSVFKYLVVKSSHSVVVLKLILQALAMGWSPDTESMTSEIGPDVTAVGQPWPSVTHHTGTNLSDTWEGREGRLFAYELIFKYLIKNHWLYTFGPAGSVLQGDSNFGRDNEQIDKNISMAEKGLHHVESEKSLACVKRRNWRQVKFLTQTDLLNRDHNTPLTKPVERFMTIDEANEKPEFFLSNGSPMGYNSPRGQGGSQTGPGQYDTTFSLLTQAQFVDNQPDMEKHGQRHELQLKKLKKLVDYNKNSTSSCRCGWMDGECLQDMSRILKVILYQTAESLGHSQWELRRIANQVLPCVAEVIRWYDINLLVTVWNSYLNVAVPTCLMTFISVLLLKESVIHAIKLIPLLHNPPHTWQDHEMCRDCLSSITTTVWRRLPTYLPHLEYLIQRQNQDRLSVQAADIILLVYSRTEIDITARSRHYLTVLRFWRRLYYFAHTQTRISAELLHNDKLQKEEFCSPLEGYLSCCLVRPDNKTQCAKQVEKLFISDLVHHLGRFVEGLPPLEVVSIGPMVAHYIGLFVEDSHICKTLSDLLQALVPVMCGCCIDQVEQTTRQLVTRCILVTLKELSALIAMKSIDHPLCQKLLTIYEELCKPVGLGNHLAVMMTGIAARLNETEEFKESLPQHPQSTDDDLYLLSNDIPTSDSPVPEQDSDSEEAIIGTPASNRFPESLTLNTSNNSGSLTGRLSALSIHSSEANGEGQVTPRESEEDGDEESSDWDSWDEEEETQSVFSGVFSEFLIKLQRTNSADFLSELKKLRDKDRSLIQSLLKS